MTDSTQREPRRAQYGEYATPEEQNRAKGVVPPPTVHVPSSAPPVEASYVPAAVPPAGARRPRPVDRVVTLLLLAFGLVTVVGSLPGYLSMAEAMQTVYDQLGIGTYNRPELAASLGVTAIVIMVVIWVAAAVLSGFSLRRNRLTWWLPLVAGALAFIAMMIIVTVALMADPAFMEYISNSATSAAP